MQAIAPSVPASVTSTVRRVRGLSGVKGLRSFIGCLMVAALPMSHATMMPTIVEPGECAFSVHNRLLFLLLTRLDRLGPVRHLAFPDAANRIL
jgi:hypothetical protein